MKILLRSLFIYLPTDDVKEFFRNYLAFVDAGLGFEIQEDSKIWEFIKKFCRDNNHSPTYDTLVHHFENRDLQVEVSDRLQILAAESPIIRGDFIKRLNDKVHSRRIVQLMDLLKEVSTITKVGMEIKKGRDTEVLSGPHEAIHYFIKKSHDLVAPAIGTRLSGEVTSDGEDFKLRYEKIKNDPLSGIGQFTGLSPMDKALNGSQKFQLWTHAAFTGHGKSMFALNWAYNQAVYYGHSNMYFSLEMPYYQVRNIFYAMHSMHEIFREARTHLGIQKDPNIPASLEYRKIRDGLLSDAEEEFLFNYVVPDFNNKDRKYGDIHIEVADPNANDFTVSDLRASAELKYSESPFSMIFVDHALLLSPRKWVSSTTERLNEVMRDLKKLAMNFRRGTGMAVVNLFQINREGFKKVESMKEKGNEPLYNLTSLSYANECERSSDVVTASYLDEELKTQSKIMFQNLKSRDDASFAPFYAGVFWDCRRILSVDPFGYSEDLNEALGDEIDGY